MNMDLVVVCAPNPWDGTARLADNRVLKAALLYGDHVHVVTPAALLLAPGLLDQDDEVVVNVGYKLFGSVVGDPISRFMLDAATGNLSEGQARLFAEAGGSVPGPGSSELIELRRQLAAHYRQVGQLHHYRLDSRTGTDSLIEAQESGFLSIEQFDTEAPWEERPLAFFEEVVKALLATDRLVVVDSDVAEMIFRWTKEGWLAAKAESLGLPWLLPSASESAAAVFVLGQLPGIDSATIREIVDIRDELEADLAGFRGLIARAGSILPEPGDPLFQRAAERWWRSEVEPSRQELVLKLTNASSWKGTGRQLVNDTLGVAAWGSAFEALSSGHPVSKFIPLALGANIFASARAMLASRKARDDARDAARTKGVLFIDRASQELSRARRRENI